MCGATGPSVVYIMGMWPPTRSLIAGPLPRYGTCCSFTPADLLNNSPRMCIGEPLPGLAYEVILPAFAAPTRSFMLPTPLAVVATTNNDCVPTWMIGAKSLSTSYAAPVPGLSTSGAVEKVFGVNSSVCPSGAAFATNELPIVPLAPVRFSTTTCWPMRGVSFSANTRASASVSPPGGNDTMIVTGLLGQACASTGAPCTAVPSAPQAIKVETSRRR